MNLAEPKVADPFFFIGINAGHYTVGDLKEILPNGDAKITLDDVCDVNEILAVQAENEYRAMKARESEMAHQKVVERRRG